MSKLGIQLIVFGKRSGEDFAGVLRDVKAAGYDGAEIGNPTDSRSAAEVKADFDAAGLLCSGYHTGYGSFEDLELLKRTALHMQGVGAKYLMCSGVKGNPWSGTATIQDYKDSAAVFNTAGKLLLDHGVHLCYHNHQWEFYDLGGTNGMTILSEETNSDHVKFCTDVYWVSCGGDNPTEFIQKHASRGVYFHLKDGHYDPVAQKPENFLELGNGQVDLKSAYAAIKSLSPAPEWITTEQDNPNGKEPAECAKISAEYARTVLGIV
jgi:sugar phosphate isomerase/epimerase